MRRAFLSAILAAMSMMAFAVPAAATVHEITGMFCAGEHGNHFPAGLSGGSNADNFAKPLFATGFGVSRAFRGRRHQRPRRAHHLRLRPSGIEAGPASHT